jgi:hypothetical protein
MNYQAAQRNQRSNRGSVTVAHRELSLLGWIQPVRSETRVMTANLQSRFVHPADLDAFLQGSFDA